MTITALALNCSLKPAASTSSTDQLIDEVFAALATHGVTSAGTIRIGERNIAAGVTSDEGDGDEGDGDEWPAVRQAILDAELFQGLNDVGFTIPAGGMTYWVGEAMHKEVFGGSICRGEDVPDVSGSPGSGYLRLQGVEPEGAAELVCHIEH